MNIFYTTLLAQEKMLCLWMARAGFLQSGNYALSTKRSAPPFPFSLFLFLLSFRKFNSTTIQIFKSTKCTKRSGIHIRVLSISFCCVFGAGWVRSRNPYFFRIGKRSVVTYGPLTLFPIWLMFRLGYFSRVRVYFLCLFVWLIMALA